MRDDTLQNELLEQFEYALPVIKTDVESIKIETARGLGGEIYLRNTGGGVLEGSVASNLPALGFTPANFTGNKPVIAYKLSLDMYKPGDAVDTEIIISSNGGELLIPVHIMVTKRSFRAEDGTVVNTLEDFLAYARESPSEAEKAFCGKDFADWLSDISCEHMELYEHFRFDVNKARAVDNFLYLHGLKRKASLVMPERITEVSLPSGRREAQSGVIYVRREEWGYVEADVTVARHAAWLNIITAKLTAASFGADGTAGIDYVLYPELMTAPRDMADVVVTPKSSKPLTHRLYVRKEPVFRARLNKNAFGFSDEGRLYIDNLTGGDLVVEITPMHDFTRFQGKRYLIGAKADIPFQVNLTTQRLARLVERAELTVMSGVMVKTVYGKTVFTRNLSMGITDMKGFVG